MAAVSRNRKRDQLKTTEQSRELIPLRDQPSPDITLQDPAGVVYMEAKKYTRPSKRTSESVARGKKLQRWLEANDHDMATFARDAGLSKMSITHYVHGDVDIASMHQRTVEKFLGAMGVSDTWAWEYFEIPPARRAYWRTFRLPPLGHGEEATQQLLTVVLDGPMSGEQYSAPAGAVVTVNPDDRLYGLQILRLEGRYVLALPDALPSQGVQLGRFVGVAPAASA